MNVKPADTTPNPGTDLTASDADGRSSGNPPTARIKIPVDRPPEAPEPTLPHHTDERPAGMTFALSWAEEQYRRRADRAEMQKKRREAGKDA